MNEKLMGCLTNPIKCKLLAEVMDNGQITAKALALKNKTVPQATLYRYLKKMVSDGIVKVVEERRIRNVIEKVYGMAIDFNADVEKMLEKNSGEAYLGLFQQFTLGLLNEFKAYCAQDCIDLSNDGSGFRVTPFYATLHELKELSGKINKLIQPYKGREASLAGMAFHSAVSFTVIDTIWRKNIL